MSYAEDYRREVRPRLQRTINLQAFLVAAGVISFLEGDTAAYEEAAYLGSARLAPDIQDDLHDWIASRFMHALIAAEARVSVHLTTLTVADYDHLPPDLQWAVASADPDYRAALQACYAR